MRDVRGQLAEELAGELAAPMQALRDRLALLVDHLDRYVSSSTGPTPYPWQALHGLRHDLGDAYLEATLLVRQLDEVRQVLSPPGEPGAVDCAPQVEVALDLLAMKHASVELLSDLAVTPPVRAAPGALAMVVTRLLFLCAQSAHGVVGAAISVRSRHEGGAVIVSIADSGQGVSLQDGELAPLAALLEQWSGGLDSLVAPGRGCSFELHLALA